MFSYVVVTNFFYTYVQWINLGILVQNINMVNDSDFTIFIIGECAPNWSLLSFKSVGKSKKTSQKQTHNEKSQLNFKLFIAFLHN